MQITTNLYTPLYEFSPPSHPTSPSHPPPAKRVHNALKHHSWLPQLRKVIHGKKVLKNDKGVKKHEKWHGR